MNELHFQNVKTEVGCKPCLALPDVMLCAMDGSIIL